MLFALTDQELVVAIQKAVRREDGLLELDLPAGCLCEARQRRKASVRFCDDTATVHCQDRSARLSPTQYRLLQYVYTHGRVSYEALQDQVWGERTSDDAIRRACSKANMRLLECGLPCELVSHRSRVSFEWDD